MFNKLELFTYILKQVDPYRPKHKWQSKTRGFQSPATIWVPSKTLRDGDLAMSFHGHVFSKSFQKQGGCEFSAEAQNFLTSMAHGT